MTTATFTGKNQNSQNGTTTYWFVLDGTDYGTDREFDNETFGIVDAGGVLSTVESDGAPTQNEYLAAIILRECKITPENNLPDEPAHRLRAKRTGLGR